MAVDPVTLGILGGTALLNLFGAKQASNASKDASAMQAQAAREAAQLQAQAQREALGFQRDVYNQGRADQQPWIQAGQGSVNKLAHLMGIGGMGGGGGFQPLRASSAGASSGPNYLTNYAGTDSREAGQNGVVTGTRTSPRGTWPGTMPDGQDGGGHPWSATDGREFGSHEWRGPIPGAPKGAVRRRPASPQTVNMQAPDGTTQAVPFEMVEHYTALGAKVV